MDQKKKMVKILGIHGYHHSWRKLKWLGVADFSLLDNQDWAQALGIEIVVS